MYSIRTPQINRVTQIPPGCDYTFIDKVHYFASNTKIAFLTLLGMGLDLFDADLKTCQSILSYITHSTINDDNDISFINRQFKDTFSLWIKKVNEDSYILDLSDKIFKDLAYTTGANLLRCKAYFTHEKITKIVLIDDTGEFTYTSNNSYIWKIAKCYVESTCMQLNLHHHVLFGHMLSQWYNISLKTCLKKNHPLLKFLSSYFDKNLALIGLTKIAGIDVFYDIDVLESHLDTRSMHIFHQRLINKTDLDGLDIHNRLLQNNFSQIPEYYSFADTIFKYYEIEEDLIQSVLDTIYPDEQSIHQDIELIKWWRVFNKGTGMEWKESVLNRENLMSVIMVLISVILDHSVQHATVGMSFKSAFNIPLRVKETRANLNGIDDPGEFYFKRVIGGCKQVLSQAGVAMGYSTKDLSQRVHKQYRMWGDHRTSGILNKDLERYKLRLAELQTQLINKGLDYYCREILCMSIRD